ncbi:hypothetical protein Aduo_010994 [Ancylostoma duodenale]
MKVKLLVFSTIFQSIRANFGCLFGSCQPCVCPSCPAATVVSEPQAAPVVIHQFQSRPPPPPTIVQHYEERPPPQTIHVQHIEERPQTIQVEHIQEDAYRPLARICGVKRWKRSADHPSYHHGISGTSHDKLCNSTRLRQLIMENLQRSSNSSKMSIAKALQEEEAAFVVLCTKKPFSFVTVHETEYCSAGNQFTHCYVFMP